ncbi:His Kinase A (phospho-acceptor) domain-containing protein [Selenomonas sp. GACV-9]|uniref:hybrid sensor histidine kinase/response regulator n=1 Tax=Selenomonas sp. GACV-9 TaxID=3158782 RepID=UPI0008E8B62A|nr:His Kinase A (phospho-acceptor) domain-containing protein [Selenomonas ruminantium]
MNRERNELNAILSALSRLYIALRVIDMRSLSCETFKTDLPFIDVGAGERFQKKFYEIIGHVASPDYLQQMLDFVTLSTLPERLREEHQITAVFRDKQFRWRRACFLRIDEGAPLQRVLYAVEDIENEKAREHITAEIASVLSESYSSIVYVDVDDGHVYPLWISNVSKKFARQLRQRTNSHEVFCTYIDSLVHPEDQEEMRRFLSRDYVFGRLKREGQIIHSYRTLRDDVYVYYRLKIASFDEGHKLIFAFENIDQDLRRQKRFASELEQRNVLLRALSKEYSSVWLVDVNAGTVSMVQNNSNSLTTNVFIKTLQGVDYYKVTDEYIDRVIVPEEREEMRKNWHLDNLRDKVLVDKIYTINYTRLTYDGKRQHYQCCYIKDSSKDGDDYYICGFRDIESTIQQEQAKQRELDAARKAAEAANEAKSRFLFNMSHDIRTPLNAIIGFTEMANRMPMDAVKQAECRTKILSASNQLLSILNDVLEMSRIENNKLVIDEELVDLQEYLQLCTTVFDGQVEEKNLTFVKKAAYKHRYLYVDKTHTSEIFINILGNAIKYTPPGGRITADMRELPGRTMDECIIEITISDTGIGMTKEFLQHAFDQFARERSASTRGIQGTGLGLAIVKRLVDLLQGTIKIESTLGEGTMVTVRLPHRIGTAAEVRQHNLETAADDKLAGNHILLAEDNELNAEIVIALLTEVGCEVDWAQDGVICVEKLEQAKPGTYDIILMDIQMPNMDGYQTTRYIRKLPDKTRANIPILAMTANAFKEDIQNAIEAGMNGHLAKPIDIPKLMQTLKKLLH